MAWGTALLLCVASMSFLGALGIPAACLVALLMGLDRGRRSRPTGLRRTP